MGQKRVPNQEEAVAGEAAAAVGTVDDCWGVAFCFVVDFCFWLW